MVLDHVAFLVDPGGPLRLPGRLVFGGFLVLLVLNLGRGAGTGKYLLRLLAFGALAQGGYALLFGSHPLWPLNSLFALLSGVVAVRVSPWLGGGLGLLTEFPLAGMAAYALGRGWVGAAALLQGGSSLLWGWSPLAAGLSALSIPLWLALLRGARQGRRGPWWIPYAFYAAHLWALGWWK